MKITSVNNELVKETAKLLQRKYRKENFLLEGIKCIEEAIEYKAWFCGHWHTDKRIDKMHFLFHSFESDEQFKQSMED